MSFFARTPIQTGTAIAFHNPRRACGTTVSSKEGLMWFVSIMFGALLIFLILLDVYLTVLYARVGAGFISHHLACLTWWTFRAIGRRLSRGRDTFLSFCGPTILVLLVTTWTCGL